MRLPYQTCPVALAHNRIGMSIGGTAKRLCSLCGDDLSECEHTPGTSYLVPGGVSSLGWCRVCLQEATLLTGKPISGLRASDGIFPL